ncbi:M20/M25/M40 family metallo-hydrolase [Candidatus Uhrbacteria bacterium]|nr:M20/M25/M40 family metallo-hydrolase [Candidatus Uhrbacteria bacterium]
MTAKPRTIHEWKSAIVAVCDRFLPEAIAMSHRLFDLKEVSGKETQSMTVLTDRLRVAGANVDIGIADIPTAFRATFGSATPRLALLAEYDALPELGHACGHHLSGVASTFAAIALVEAHGRNSTGSLEVIGTPMEESGGGKILMTERGVFAGLDGVLMTHTSNETRAAYRTVAAQSFRIVLEADQKDYHWRSRNITDVLVDALLVLRAVENRAGVGTQIMWAVPEGGTQSNVVPSRMVVDCSLWSYDEAVLLRTLDRIRSGVARVVSATKVRVDVDAYEPLYLPLEPSGPLVATFERNLKFLDIPYEPRQGRLYDATDIGNVSHVVPTLHADIVVDASRTHTPEHVAACSGPAGEQYLRRSMTTLALTVFDLLRDPDDLARAKRELAQRKLPKELNPGRLP